VNYGTLTKAQAKALKPFIFNRVVTDLGAGNCKLTLRIHQLGAAKTIAVDKEPKRTGAKSFEYVQSYFHQYQEDIDVAFISWPVNWYVRGLLEAIKRAKTIVYMGTNFGGSTCGFLVLWQELAQREVLLHLPHPKSSLTIYSSKHTARVPLGEEQAALDTSRIYNFNDVYFKG